MSVPQEGVAEAQLVQPKRATLCTLPWLSVCSTSTGGAACRVETLPELLAWLRLPLVSDHVLMAAPILPAMPLAWLGLGLGLGIGIGIGIGLG